MMTTGYIAGLRGDLDDLFKARAAAAIANTGFLSNGGVDLAQRFEPRAGSTPIANVGFLSNAHSGQDLALLFMDKLAGAGGHTMTAGVTGSSTGYSDGVVHVNIPADSFSSPTLPNGFTVSGLLIDLTGPKLTLIHASTTPPNADTSWQGIGVTGIFADSGGVSVTRNASRNTSSYTSGSAGGFVFGTWNLSGNFAFVSGQSYNVVIVNT